MNVSSYRDSINTSHAQALKDAAIKKGTHTLIEFEITEDRFIDFYERVYKSVRIQKKMEYLDINEYFKLVQKFPEQIPCNLSWGGVFVTKVEKIVLEHAVQACPVSNNLEKVPKESGGSSPVKREEQKPVPKPIESTLVLIQEKPSEEVSKSATAVAESKVLKAKNTVLPLTEEQIFRNLKDKFRLSIKHTVKDCIKPSKEVGKPVVEVTDIAYDCAETKEFEKRSPSRSARLADYSFQSRRKDINTRKVVPIYLEQNITGQAKNRNGSQDLKTRRVKVKYKIKPQYKEREKIRVKIKTRNKNKIKLTQRVSPLSTKIIPFKWKGMLRRGRRRFRNPIRGRKPNVRFRAPERSLETEVTFKVP